MSKLTKALTAAAGNAGGTLGYVEDVFSTYLYVGTQSTQSITNGIDLAEEGGLVWTKTRQDATDHFLFDTERGVNKSLTTNKTSAENSFTNELMSFNSDGFTLGSGYYANWSLQPYASWTFRKAEKFFDVVTYTGDSSSSTQISHSLGSTPGFIVCKRTSTSGGWAAYHASLGTGKYLSLNGTHDAVTDSAFFPEVTDGFFRPGSDNDVNGSGYTYVAYLFASDAGGFGDDGSESIIKCGSYTGTGSTSNPAIVDCGFEPQWVLIKNAGSSENWILMDSMRGILANGAGDDSFLKPNSADAEETNSYINLTATGFEARTTSNVVNENGKEHIYIAIRRPMKTPESGTEVFDVDFGNNVTSSGDKVFPSSITVDALLYLLPSGGGQYFYDRMRGGQKVLQTSSTAAETSGGFPQFDTQTGVNSSTVFNFSSRVGAAFKRATGFFDVVAYTGDGVAGREIPHNLGAVPQLMITKIRNTTGLWRIGYTADQIYTNWGSTGYSWISNGNIYGDGTQWIDPTDSVVTVDDGINASGSTYIQYLFGTLAGVSKVGSYTGNGTTQNIECGFSGGARFLMLWNRTNPTFTYVWDSERGIITGSPDPRLAINSTAAEVTTNDALNTYAGGFGVTSSTVANRNGDTYIFLAIA